MFVHPIIRFLYRQPGRSFFRRKKEEFYNIILPYLYKKLPNVQIGENNVFTSPYNLSFKHDKAALKIGNDNFFSAKTTLAVFEEGKLEIGDYCAMWEGRIGCRFKITIGDMFLAAENFIIEDSIGHPVDSEWRKRQILWFAQNRRKKTTEKYDESELTKEERQFIDHFAFAAMPPMEDVNVGEIIIGNNVWIGRNVTILKGAKIGDNCVIATGSIVTKEIPANCVAAGIPAKPVKKLPVIPFQTTMKKVKEQYKDYISDPRDTW